jgi:hypothetical protein
MADSEKYSHMTAIVFLPGAPFILPVFLAGIHLPLGSSAMVGEKIFVSLHGRAGQVLR